MVRAAEFGRLTLYPMYKADLADQAPKDMRLVQQEGL
jgi:hypothetical protein